MMSWSATVQDPQSTLFRYSFFFESSSIIYHNSLPHSLCSLLFNTKINQNREDYYTVIPADR